MPEGQEPTQEPAATQEPVTSDGKVYTEADWKRLSTESANHRRKAKEVSEQFEALRAENERNAALLGKLKGVFGGDDSDPAALETRIAEEQKNRSVAEQAFVESKAISALVQKGCAFPDRAVALLAYRGAFGGLKPNFGTRSVEGLEDLIAGLQESDPDLFGTGQPATPPAAPTGYQPTGHTPPSARQVSQTPTADPMEAAVAALDQRQREVAARMARSEGWDEATGLRMYCYRAAEGTDKPLPKPIITKVK